jgi:dipeptidyl-peptidase-4
VSHDGKYAIHVYSTFSTPETTSIVSLPDHKTVTVLADNKDMRERLLKANLPKPEFFRIPIENGRVELDAYIIHPPNYDPALKYPVLFYVYGEPAMQVVRDMWGGRTSLWHIHLAQLGYVIVSIDNRGTPSPRGRSWRKCVYRKIGILAPADQAAATSTLLKSRPYLDEKRVAIWGWSGGGSMSLNAIFRFPDLYSTAMSVAPVPNQRVYDTVYQERYMGLPSDNVEGFRDGSPITHAKNLKGNLLLVHGTGDDNCHYAGTEVLINELILNNKQFSMLAYPNRSHSISEGPNTTRHLFTLLANYLKNNVKPGGVDPDN